MLTGQSDVLWEAFCVGIMDLGAFEAFNDETRGFLGRQAASNQSGEVKGAARPLDRRVWHDTET